MKNRIYGMMVVIFIAILSLVGTGCVPLEQSTTQPGSTSGAGLVEVHVTDAPPEEEVTSVLVTVSKVEIHKAGGTDDTEQEKEQEQQQQTQQLQSQATGTQTTPVQTQQQIKDKEQKQEKNGNSQKPEDKQVLTTDNSTKTEKPVKTQEQEQEQEQEKESDGGSWKTIEITAGTTFDLLKIKGLDQLFAVSEVGAGKYTQVRLIIDKIEVGLGGKTAEEVKLPSGELKLVHPFEVVDGETTEIMLDFDAAKMVNVTNGKVIVKPTVKMDVKQKPAAKPDTTKDITLEDSQKAAEKFVKEDETFAFDGITDTLALTGTVSGECHTCRAFTWEYDSRHAGYGNRIGQVLAEVITHHKAVISVEQGKVTSAVMDGKWDMLQEKEITTQASVITSSNIY